MPEQVIEIWTPAKLLAATVATLVAYARRIAQRPLVTEGVRREK